MHINRLPFWVRCIEGEGGAAGSAGGDEGNQEQNGDPANEGEGEGEGKTFTQAEVDQLIKQRLAQQARNKFGDYNDLKEKAGKSQTLEERIAAMEKSSQDAELKALRAEIAGEHGLSKEDRDLLLTGTDEDTIRQQAKRLSDNSATTRKRGPSAPKEGNTTKPSASEEREAARQLFGT